MPITGAFIMPHPPIILPEIGKGEELKVQKTIDACKKVGKQIEKLRPDTIVLTSPHSVSGFDFFNISYGNEIKGNLAQFNAPDIEINIKYDIELAEAIAHQAKINGINTQFKEDAKLDHGAIVPLTFVNEQYKNYKVVCISLSEHSTAEHYKLGICISDIAKKSNKNIVFLASGDLSHKVSPDGPYGFAEEGVKFNQMITDAMGNGDFLKFLTFDPKITQKAAECGLRSFIIMAGALDGVSVEAQLLSYEGTFGIGYAVASFIPKNEDENRRFLKRYLQITEGVKALPNKNNEYVSLAKDTVEYYVKTGKHMNRPENLSENLLSNKAGVFVSIKKNGELRGCIGTIEPITKCIADEVINNAISACSRDYRFKPIHTDELNELKYSIDVLSPTQKVSSTNELDAKRYGVVVTNGNRHGLLLPNLEGVDTVDEQISIAMEKSGIEPSEPYNLERFEVVRYN